jgi:hypothetical protein
MLNEEVVEAVRKGRFHIYPISTIDEGIETLTGVNAGQLKSDGTYEPGTVHYRVNKRLGAMNQRMVALRGSSGLDDETSRSEVEALAQPRSKP